MGQLIYELNGVKYLLVELQLRDSNKEEMAKITKDFSCIFQGIKEIKQSGLLTNGYAIVKYLVPESNVIAFNKAIEK